jgi:hypothetical protein
LDAVIEYVRVPVVVDEAEQFADELLQPVHANDVGDPVQLALRVRLAPTTGVAVDGVSAQVGAVTGGGGVTGGGVVVGGGVAPPGWRYDQVWGSDSLSPTFVCSTVCPRTGSYTIA